MVHLVRPQFSKMFPLSSKFKLNDPLDSSLAIWTTTSFSRYVDELKLKSKFIAIEIPRQQFHQMHQPTHRHESVFEIYRVAQCLLMKRQQLLCYLWLITAGAFMPSVPSVIDNRMTEELTQLRSVFLLWILISIYNQRELDSSFLGNSQTSSRQGPPWL